GAIGTLTTTAGAFASTLSGATFQVDLSNPAAADQLALGSGAAVNLTGATLSVNVLATAVGNVYTIVSSPSGGVSGTFSSLAQGATLTAAGRTFQVHYTSTAVTLT